MKISIIIPVYNCAKYLRECLDSALKQEDVPQGTELEILAVDDGSSDGSERICDEYKQKYPNCKVIHQENQGVSVARNTALDNITGEYVTFLDGDDILDKYAIKIIAQAGYENYDELFFGMFHYSAKSERYNETPTNLSAEKDTEVIRIVQHQSLSCVWGGIYKRTLFEGNNIRFQAGIRMGEDWQVALKLFVNANSYKCITNCLYGYRDNEESATKKKINYVRPDALIVLNDIVDYVKQRGYTVTPDDIAMARSGLRRNMMKDALKSKLFKETDNAFKQYGDQSLWKDLKYSGTAKHFGGFLLYRVVDWFVKQIGKLKALPLNLIHVNLFALWIIILCILLLGKFHSKINADLDKTFSSEIDFVFGLFKVWYINLFVFVSLGIAFIKELKKIWQDNIISLTRISLLIFLFQVLIVNSSRSFATTILGFSYFGFFVACFSFLLLADLIKLPLNIYRKKHFKKEDKEKGLTIDAIDSQLSEKSSRKALARITLQRALSTNLSKESFAVGIIGDWGSGKTMFLNTLLDLAQDYGYCIQFKPWNCSSPQQIVEDFFGVLRHKLSKYVSTLSDEFTAYAKILKTIAVDNIKDNLSKSLVQQLPITERKEEVEKEIRKLGKPVIVFIDDLDRLNADEIFEVFRLIRNTASFPNLIYFVAFDKTYTIKMLDESYKDSERYVEKIFQVEVPLPYAEPMMLYRTFVKDLRDMLTDEDIHLLGVNSITYSDLQELSKIMPNFREIRRLTRLYALELSHYKKQYGGKMELSSIDILWLTVIMMIDYRAYQDLYFHMENFFTNPTCKPSDALSLKSEYGLDEKVAHNLKEKTRRALVQLFSGNHYYTNSIRVSGNYYNYFYLGIGHNFMAYSDFKDYLFKNEDIEKKIREKYFNKSNDSIFMHFDEYNPRNHNLNENKNYFKALLCWIKLKHPSMAYNFFNDKLTTYNIPDVQITDIKTYVKELLSSDLSSLSDYKAFVYYSELLKRCYTFYPDELYEDDNWKGPSELLTDTEIKNLFNILMNHYLETFNADAYDILDGNSSINNIYRNATIEEDYDTDCIYYDNLCVDTIIIHFSQNGEKSSRLEDAKKRFTSTESNPTYYEEDTKYLDKEKKKLFGGDNKYKRVSGKVLCTLICSDISRRTKKTRTTSMITFCIHIYFNNLYAKQESDYD